MSTYKAEQTTQIVSTQSDIDMQTKIWIHIKTPATKTTESQTNIDNKTLTAQTHTHVDHKTQTDTQINNKAPTENKQRDTTKTLSRFHYVNMSHIKTELWYTILHIDRAPT